MSASSSYLVGSSSGAFVALLKRLYFYIGVFIGPFLLVAALSGVLYALTPQIENTLYAHALHTETRGSSLSLQSQVQRAVQQVGPGLSVAAVRPAPGQGDTTRVMFSDPRFGASEHRALFVDPVSGEIRGDMKVYGTSGVLPLRTWIDQFHRGLLLGDIGRIYSELAASWLWVAAMGGLVLWAARRRRVGRQPGSLRSWHASAGVWLLLGLLFFSATGLTWSQYAGDNIGVLRAYYGWSTPSVSTALSQASKMQMPMDEHAEHHLHMAPPAQASTLDAALFDRVLAKARAAHIDAAKVEIKPSSSSDKAWVVSEIDRSWPTQVDAVSINPQTMDVVDHVEFSAYSLPAKLTRWGIDAHMGALFGQANQLVLVVFASGLAAMVVMGYLMWWRRRPTLPLSRGQQTTLLSTWRLMNFKAQAFVVLFALLLGIALPVLGWSLIGFIVWTCCCALSECRSTLLTATCDRKVRK
ncbi:MULTISPECIES: PepSY-associated TM helix domain-containing protein [Pseudomonas]|uniref:PepSY-associated TM helix domain-containing protein n=1 Tax=Pseudomonas TaxID=286 RepID=UPI001867131F|nr:PepSY-associated TM helix domain-containing protein [Pseudomonas lundensis]